VAGASIHYPEQQQRKRFVLTLEEIELEELNDIPETNSK
jgi:uncharacterized protein YjiS (DUF1127 family)